MSGNWLRMYDINKFYRAREIIELTEARTSVYKPSPGCRRWQPVVETRNENNSPRRKKKWKTNPKSDAPSSLGYPSVVTLRRVLRSLRLPSSTPAECTPPKNPAVVVVVVANLTTREFRGQIPFHSI